MMHITKSASAYMENVWLWTADHDIDDPDLQDDNNTMVSILILMTGSVLCLNLLQIGSNLYILRERFACRKYSGNLALRDIVRACRLLSVQLLQGSKCIRRHDTD